MKPPSKLTYNDLNGAEATEILVDWFRQLLRSQPLLQPHLTLPMADIRLNVEILIDMHIGGTVPASAPPERLTISGQTNVQNEVSGEAGTYNQHSEVALTAQVNAAPIAGGQPPDHFREVHGLAVTRPGHGPREIGAHVQIADVQDRQGIVADGYTFAQERGGPITEQTIQADGGAIVIDLTGKGTMHQGGMVVQAGTHKASQKEFGDGKGATYGTVTGTYDMGPAGLNTSGGGHRSKLSFGNNK